MMIANRMSSITISAFMDAITDDVSDSICRRSDNRASMVSPMRSSESASDPPTSLCEATAACRRTRSLLPVRFAMSSSAATISPSICIAPAQARSSDFRGSSEFSPTERRALSIEDPARMFSATMGSDRANCSSNRALRLFPRERTHSSAIRGPMRAKPIPISPRAMNPMRAPAPASKTRRMIHIVPSTSIPASARRGRGVETFLSLSSDSPVLRAVEFLTRRTSPAADSPQNRE